ncbi:MAG: alkaline phosphatase [Thermoguttaceae bacterium]|nr:alkaline phosphatase [Thermoguttaceae bacterium]
MRKSIVAATFAALFLVVGAVASFAQDAQKSPVGVERVIWIGSDGFGSHYVNWDELPNLRKLRDGGAWTLHMRSVLPSSSAINWETQIAGAPSEMHGYRTWGSKKPDLPPIYVNENGRFPCIYKVLKDANPEIVSTSIYSWDGIGYLYDKTAVADDRSVKGDPAVFEGALEQFDKNPTFAFVYFSEPDSVGHGIGWGTPEYQKMLTTIDDYVGKLLAELEKRDMMKNTLVIFTSDHGGTGKGHGDGVMEHMEVPFILYGQGVKPGEIKDVVVHFDVAATIAWALGAPRPQAWRGVPVESAFQK